MDQDFHYSIGLDIGIASVGWAVLQLKNDEPFKIVDLNSRIFTKAENPKDGSSLAMKRRAYRGIRRLIRRKRNRLDRLEALFEKYNLIDKESLSKLFSTPADVFKLRTKGLDLLLNNNEWSRVLFYLCKHRGFKSNRKKAADNIEGAVLKSLKENTDLLANYRTVGEMMHTADAFAEKKRNTTDSYKSIVLRSQLLDEINILFENQRKLGSKLATQAFQDEYIEIFSSQRFFDEGPGKGSPYGGAQIEKLIGNCTLEKTEKRAAKASWSFMMFSLLEKINHLRIVDSLGCERSLTAKERELIIELALKKSVLTMADVRSKLELSSTDLFKNVMYKKADIKNSNEINIIDTEKALKIQSFVPYHAIRKALGSKYSGNLLDSPEQLNLVGYAFTVYKNDERIKDCLKGKIDDTDLELLIENLKGFTKFGHISVKACNKLIPYMKEGDIYSDACQKANYLFNTNEFVRTVLLPARADELEDIKNPVVRRAISQTIKVVNAIILKYGSPTKIHIELAREMSKSFTERFEIQKKQKDNYDKNQKAITSLQEMFPEQFSNGQLPKYKDVLKFKLFKEQNELSVYSLKHIPLDRLFDDNYVQIDHILPYSISLDDSYNNKVLVLTSENQEKKNRTPLAYLKDQHPELVEKFKTYVINTYAKTNIKKRDNLLNDTEEYKLERSEWSESNINDTRYICSFMQNYIKDHLEFNKFELSKNKKHVICVNGLITSKMRRDFGIQKVRANGDLHHAIDAVIVALTTDGMINKISRYYKKRETLLYKAPGLIIEKPWDNFTEELSARLSEDVQHQIAKLNLNSYTVDEIKSLRKPFVSRMPNRKIIGPAHKDTFSSAAKLKEGIIITRKELSKIKLTKDNEIEGFYQKDRNINLYNALVEFLQKQKLGGEADKFNMPTKDGSRGPEVKKIKIEEKITLGVVLKNKSIAANGSMIRVDVFYIPEGKDKGYYLIPIYVADTVKKELPNKAIIQGKNINQWKIMDDKDFIFSLYQNDLIKITAKKEYELSPINKNGNLQASISLNDFWAYYQGTDIGSASINIITNDNSYGKRGLGVKTLVSLTKFTVGVLGEVTEVKHEKRLGFK